MTGETPDTPEVDDTMQESEAGESGGRFAAMTPRQAFTLIGVALTALLVVLLVILVLLLRSGTLVTQGGVERAGLEPVLTIEGPGRGSIPTFARPMAAAFGPNDRIYVVDSDNNRIAVFSRRGRFLFDFGGFGIAKPLPGFEATWEEGQLNFPLGIDIDPDGFVYVADFRNDQIQVFDAEGDFVRRFPDPGQAVGQGGSGQDGTGIAVTDVAVRGEYVYVTDAYQVVVFTKGGEFVRQFGQPGQGPGQFDRPNGIAVTRDGTIVVSDSNNARVQAFSPEGQFRWSTGRGSRQIGSATPEDDRDALFGLPRGVAVLEDGTIAVVDSFEYEIVLLSAEGRIIGRFGQRGANPGQLNLPNGIGAAGDLVVVADKENNRVQVLRLVR